MIIPTAFAAVTMMIPMPGPATSPPVCETVHVYENSGNGPNYPIRLCGSRALPVRSLTVDGAALPERNTAHKRVVFWSRY